MTEQFMRLTGAALLGVSLLLLPASVHAQSVTARYESLQAREVKVLKSVAATGPAAPAATRVITEAHAVISGYEALVRRYRSSGYADNALFNAAGVASALHERFGQSRDRDTAVRLYKRLAAEYPTSSLVQQVTRLLERLASTMPAAAAPAPAAVVAAPASLKPPAAPLPPPSSGRARLIAVERSVLPEAVRVTLQLDREVSFNEEKLAGPARVFLDLKDADAAPELAESVLRYPTDVVRQIRIGRHPDRTVRVVLDLEGVNRHSVYMLYNPFRLVIDAEPAAVAMKAATPVRDSAVAAPAALRGAAALPPLISTAPPPPVTPAVPAINGAGGFSIARQLGLGVSRIVIDAGHGGHDPGAQANGLSEAELTLDVALRLEKLLQKEPGLEVVLTRRTNVYLPLEERTAIANREGADLFLSIHANTSRNTAARGVETYFLSFAGSPEAEAVAARENASHSGEMHKLPDIIRAITLNNKLDESRDLAGMVQEALVTRLRRANKNVDNRGVKKAPFVVLIGAEMPSVLAEVSFLTNKQELALLKTASYKQRIAEALHAAVMRYRRSLKGAGAIAAQ